MYNDTVALFSCIDDFCKIYEEWEKEKLINTGKIRNRQGKLDLSEKLFIVILYHFEKFKDFKHYYLYGIEHKHRDKFKELPCYDRFIQIMPSLIVPLSILLQMSTGEKTGIYFIDSSSLNVCRNKRISRNRVFKGLAKRGKTTMGWFFGFKLHMVINHKGEIMAVKITKGNVDDREPVDILTKNLKGSCYADKGYIGKKLHRKLYARGLRLVVGIRKNMVNYLMPMMDKILLRKRFLIETVFGVLKKSMNIEHTRHRSPKNFLVNILAGLVAYCFRKNKPSFKSRNKENLIHS